MCFTELQVRNLDASALRASFSILNHHFPERINTIYMWEVRRSRKAPPQPWRETMWPPAAARL